MQKRYIPLALFFVALLVFLAHLGARIHLAEPAFTFAEEQKEIYLTFDDGPSTVVTNRVLDVLQKENVKATFFIVSDRAETRKDVLLRIAAEGHTLGVHSKSHDYAKIYASDDALMRDADECAKFIERVTGIVPRVCRLPGGGLTECSRRTSVLEGYGYRVVSWNAVCGDEEIPHADAETLYRRTLETSAGKNRIVLLMHDSAPHASTAEALPRIIAHFREEGYAFRAF